MSRSSTSGPKPPPSSLSGLFSRPFFWGSFLGLFLLFLVVSSSVSDQTGESVDIVIPRGTTIGNVARVLSEQKVIRFPGLFKRVLQLSSGSKGVRAGEYRFHRSMSYIGALTVLYFDEPIVHPVTIPEGWTVRQIAAALASEQLVDEGHFIELALDPTAASKFQLKSPTLEGFLYPDTYTFSKIDGAERILERMVQRLLSKLDTDLRNRARVMNLPIEKWVTLASIIEKETGSAGERELISSVFHNRLKKGMRLQSDPTTIYGISNFDGNLKRKHLLERTPYNTYAIYGLPPGPIASPGIAALRAALYPADTKYLYFVANNRGGHIFAETLVQHNNNVEEYQRRPYRVQRRMNASEGGK